MDVLRRVMPAFAIDDPNRNTVRRLWDRLGPLPGGRRMFSTVISRGAPYTHTIRPDVRVLREGFAEVWMRDRPGLRNHLRSLHAIALANLAEFTGNLALAYGLPDDGRFIVARMSIEYLKKARGPMRGTCDCPAVPSSERREFEVPVTIWDSSDEACVKATLHSLVGPKRNKNKDL